MANLLTRLRGGSDEERYNFDQWVIDKLESFVFGGNTYPLGLQTSMTGATIETPDGSLSSYMRALRSSPPAFGAQVKRSRVLSQARFAFRRLADSSRGPKGSLWTSTALTPLERPWPSGTTGELIQKMEWHAGVVGNAYVVARGDQRRTLHPDWVDILLGSDISSDDPGWQLDCEVLGYIYWPGGKRGGDAAPQTLLPSTVAHWSPLPDPETCFRGMSWVTPAVREMQGDSAATQHKVKFFENGATPNLVVSGIQAPTREQFQEIVADLERSHKGVANAYRTLYLSPGVDATVIGSDLKQVDFKATQGAGETRLSVLSEVPAPILGTSEGLAGSALNAGNLAQVRRNWADTWIFSQLQSLAQALEPLVSVPADSELWYDPTDMPILRQDATDAAAILSTEAATIRQLVDGGFEPESVVAAIKAGDMAQLVHTGNLSVQLTPANGTDASGNPVDDGSTDAESARQIAEMIQKIYLGVNKVVDADEAREILNRAGANLPPGYSPPDPMGGTE